MAFDRSVDVLVQEAIRLIGEVAGPGVQTYEEPNMTVQVIRGFNLLFKKYPWPQYRQWFRVQLDGATGVITTDAFEYVRDFEDIIAVHRDAEATPLPGLTSKQNPFVLTGSAGSQTMVWTALPATHAQYHKRKIQVYPATATGWLNVAARVYPVKQDDTLKGPDLLYLDFDMLASAAAFMTMVMDDTNVDAAKALENLMELRFRDIINQLNSIPMAQNMQASIPTTWMEQWPR